MQANLLRLRVHPSVPICVLVGAARPQPRWIALQRDLARRFDAGPPVLLPDSAHQIPIDRPDAVAAAIRGVADRAEARWVIETF